MALITMNFESQYLRGNTEISVILPDKPRSTEPVEFYGNGKKYKVLWLLHGSFGDHSDWIRKSNIELYACENDLVVVMPSALNSAYTDWHIFADGFEMNRYFLEELMPMIWGWFPVSTAKEDNYIAGLSMGGSGTLKFALTHPERFAKAAVLSAAPLCYEEDEGKLAPNRAMKLENSIRDYGSVEAYLKSDDNLWRILEEIDPKLVPPLYCGIGGDDRGLDSFLRFQKLASEMGIEAEFEIIPGFAHEWRVWEITIQRALKFFGLSSRMGGNVY